jgi:PTS system nitrogen regulatory IIA component|tara:strand:+ start:167 stop:637 length:471 start_codon:yes stop_codon:yes gene_type:complete
MNILDYLDKNCIVFNVKHKNKKSIIASILDHLIDKNKIAKDDRKVILKTILKREEMGSTAIGGHIAFPHARLNTVKDIIICFCISSEGVDFDSLDQDPVNVIALLLSDQKEAGLHLKMLAFLAKLLRDKYLVQRLKAAKTSQEVILLLEKQQRAIA